MKKYNLALGLIGGTLTVCIAPGLICAGYYLLGALTFLVGMWIIDYNRS